MLRLRRRSFESLKQRTQNLEKANRQYAQLYQNPVSRFFSASASVIFWLLYWLALIFIAISFCFLLIGFLLPGYAGYYFNRFMDKDLVEQKFEL